MLFLNGVEVCPVKIFVLTRPDRVEQKEELIQKKEVKMRNTEFLKVSWTNRAKPCWNKRNKTRC